MFRFSRSVGKAAISKPSCIATGTKQDQVPIIRFAVLWHITYNTPFHSHHVSPQAQSRPSPVSNSIAHFCRIMAHYTSHIYSGDWRDAKFVASPKLIRLISTQISTTSLFTLTSSLVPTDNVQCSHSCCPLTHRPQSPLPFPLAQSSDRCPSQKPAACKDHRPAQGSPSPSIRSAALCS